MRGWERQFPIYKAKHIGVHLETKSDYFPLKTSCNLLMKNTCVPRRRKTATGSVAAARLLFRFDICSLNDTNVVYNAR